MRKLELHEQQFFFFLIERNLSAISIRSSLYLHVTHAVHCTLHHHPRPVLIKLEQPNIAENFKKYLHSRILINDNGNNSRPTTENKAVHFLHHLFHYTATKTSTWNNCNSIVDIVYVLFQPNYYVHWC